MSVVTTDTQALYGSPDPRTADFGGNSSYFEPMPTASSAAISSSMTSMPIDATSPAPKLGGSAKIGDVAGEYEQVPLRIRVRIWVALVLTQCISNIDSGGCAVLAAYPNGQITRDFGLDAFEVGLVLSIMYMGHTFGCLVAAYLLMKYSSKYLLCTSLVLYAFCVLGFALSNGFAMALIMRLVGGFVSALLVVFGPIWVDDFGPPTAKSLWMSLVQAGVPLGITFGYLAVGFVEANTTLSWEYFFYGQASLLLIATLFFLINPDNALNRPIHFHLQQRDAMEVHDNAHHSKVRRVLRRMAKLLLNPIYVCLVMGLCALYFVVNGLQMWVTSYLEGPPIRAEKNAIVAVFGVCSATGPIAGVLFGGWAIDRIGGYDNIMRTSIAATVLGAFACVMSFASLLTDTLSGFAACTWILLFFGGAVVPALVGMSLSTVDARLRPLASGFGSCTYNLLGFFLGPFIAGAVADSAGVVWGYRTIMGTSSLAVVFTGAVPIILKLREAVPTVFAAESTNLLVTSDTETSEQDTPAEGSAPSQEDVVHRMSMGTTGRPSLVLPRSHATRVNAGDASAIVHEAARGHVVTVD